MTEIPGNYKPPIINTEGHIDWEIVLERGKAQNLTAEEGDIIVAEFEKVEKEVDDFLQSEEGKEYLARLGTATGQDGMLIFKIEEYDSRTLSYVYLGPDGFNKWGYSQANSITTEEALRHALHGGIMTNISQFVPKIKQEIDRRVPKK